MVKGTILLLAAFILAAAPACNGNGGGDEDGADAPDAADDASGDPAQDDALSDAPDGDAPADPPLDPVEDSDPCAGVTCSGHGECAVVDREPQCLCDTGYHAEGLECVEDTVDCAGAEVLCVDDTAGPSQEYDTIQAAVDDAGAGDLVLVFEGSYAGFRVESGGEPGSPLVIRANGTNVVIDSKGRIVVDDSPADRLLIVEFDKTALLEKEGNSLYRYGGQEDGVSEATIFHVKQGCMERSNVNPTEEMIKLIQVFREFEAAQKGIQNMDEITSRLVNDSGLLA